MPALPTDALRATRVAKIVTLTDTLVKSVYPAARDALPNPEPGFFEDAADASTVLALKAQLIGKFRRRFRVDIGEMVSIDPTQSVPSYQLVDVELSVNTPVILARFEIDLQNETSAMEVIG